jgi:uncharacterized protein
MWRQKLTSFLRQYDHPSWGITHSERVYALSLKLAEQQDIRVDKDALLAASYTHAVGALGPYRQAGTDYAELSAAFAEEMLMGSSFAQKKIALVKDIILGQAFHAKPTSREAIIFHDAYLLDFLGAIGIVRLLAMVGLDDWTPDVEKAIALIRRFSRELHDRLLTPPGKKIGKVRQAEMRAFLAALADETEKMEIL